MRLLYVPYHTFICVRHHKYMMVESMYGWNFLFRVNTMLFHQHKAAWRHVIILLLVQISILPRSWIYFSSSFCYLVWTLFVTLPVLISFQKVHLYPSWVDFIEQEKRKRLKTSQDHSSESVTASSWYFVRNTGFICGSAAPHTSPHSLSSHMDLLMTEREKWDPQVSEWCLLTPSEVLC